MKNKILSTKSNRNLDHQLNLIKIQQRRILIAPFTNKNKSKEGKE
jgi:hypothetical protein